MAVTKQALNEIHLRTSRQLLTLLLSLSFASFCALWVSGLWLWFKVVLSILLTILCYRFHHYHLAFQHTHSITHIRLFNNQWRVRCRNGQWYRAWPKGSAVVTAFLICFRIEIEGHHSVGYVILLPDSAKANCLHAFRLKLMLEAHNLFGTLPKSE